MENQIMEILKETIHNKLFIPVTIIILIVLITKNLLDYKKYLRTCEIFNQKPKLSGYIKNSILNVFIIILLTTIGFTGYTGLINSQKYENIYNKKIEDDRISPTNSQYKNTNNIKKIKNKKPFKLININNSEQKKEKENWRDYKYKNGIKTIKEYKNKKLVKEIIEYKNGKIITREYTNNPLNMIIETEN